MNSQLGVAAAIAVLLGAVFLIDVRTGLGFSPWLLYVLPLWFLLDVVALCPSPRRVPLHCPDVRRLWTLSPGRTCLDRLHEPAFRHGHFFGVSRVDHGLPTIGSPALAPDG